MSDAKAIFCEALEKPPQEVAAYLDRACGEDKALRGRVEVLLRANQEAGHFLGDPTGQDATLDTNQVGEVPGSQIGPYKLVERLGEGTFGAVFMAEQRDSLRRSVAIKIIKPGMDSREIIARFEAERQALAVMNHPNIARVFGAGATPSGRPYFAMELVKGLPVTDYCDHKKLTTERRLALFIGVCQAVQHAHQKGIIHRDLKPSNILVAETDDTPCAKVIDFGIAKALHQPLTEHTLVTHPGQRLGTPIYMSPEQADPKCPDIDTRSDIYSLGVVLYELLTGSTPVDRTRFKNATPEDFTRIICEEEPPRPSTRISSLGDTAREVCRHRQTEPKKLSALMRRDLDWIVMKCLEKDRSRRYDTASALARDIQRYLDHQPVEATPPSAWYSFRKFARRNQRRIRIATVALLLLGLVIFGGRRLQVLAEQNASEEAKTTAHEWIGEAERHLEGDRIVEAFKLLQDAADVLPGDPKIQQLMPQASSTWTFDIHPPDAIICVRPCGSDGADWQPLVPEPRKLPKVEHVWKVERSGCATAMGCSGPGDVHLKISLAPVAPTDEPGRNMVRITFTTPSGEDYTTLVDSCEVSNGQFAQFVANGGYQREDFWRHLAPYLFDGKEVTFEELMSHFRDKSGQFGPRTWEDGSYPAGQADYPVRGISWYEAAAYAKSVTKLLPTIHDWERAACFDQADQLAFRSNLGSTGPAPVGRLETLNSLGLFDMAGNVKEWCRNATVDGSRAIRGGGWLDHLYIFRSIEIDSPWSRPEDVGFRCVRYPEPLPGEEGGPFVVDVPTPPGEVKKEPLEEFERIRKFFLVDQGASLNQKTVRAEDSAFYRHEVIEINAAYGNERFQVHLLLPTSSETKTQRLHPIVYHPGNGVKRIRQFSTSHGDFAIAAALVRSGRAVCFPVYQGTFERSGVNDAADTGQKKRDLEIQGTKDLIQAVNYLATRPDMDMGRLTYLGWSWGGNVATRMVTVEDRFRACIIMGGGLQPSGYTELDGRTYAPYVAIPVLMLGGTMDTVVSFQARQLPLLKALEACPDKTLEEFESHHSLPLEEAIPKIGAWLDERFPPTATRPEDRTNWLRQVAELMMKQKRFPEAEATYAKVITLLTEQKGPDHRDTLFAARMHASAIRQQGRQEGISMLQRCLDRQREILGEKDADTQATAQEIADACGWLAYRLGKEPDRRPEEYRRAVALAQRGIDVATRAALPPGYRMSSIALAYYRLSLLDECLATVDDALANDAPNSEVLFVLALCHEAAGRHQTAKDWYAAACEWVAKQRWNVSALHREAASRLELPLSWPPKDWSRSEHVELYSRLIQEKPELARLYYCRGSHYGRMSDWRRAKADYVRASELNPSDFRSAEASTAVTLYDGTPEEQQAAVKQFYDAWHGQSSMGVVVLCSLLHKTDIDPREIDRIADDVLAARSKADFFSELSKGMSLCRRGDYEEALAVLPQGKAENPKDELLAVLFRAMAHYHLSDAYTCRKLLERAREGVREQIDSPEGPLLPYQDRPVVWCMVHTVLREAESLIGPVSDSGETVDSKVAGGVSSPVPTSDSDVEGLEQSKKE
jgi:serine/threonine protein kinase/tetratricopeptide (TPR) repeat protein